METRVLDRATKKMPPAEAFAFLKTVPMFDALTAEDREAFCERGEILDSPGGRRLIKFLAKRGAEAVLVEKYGNAGNHRN